MFSQPRTIFEGLPLLRREREGLEVSLSLLDEVALFTLV
jgi:hypothetical protein